jgi:hypothetical protein
MDREASLDHERWQSDTADYRDRLMQCAEAAPGYAGAELRHESRELLLFGVGEPSASVIELMDEAPDDVRVSWHPAPYSHAELMAEVQRITATATWRSRLHSGWARHDGTGVVFTTEDRSLLDADDARLALGATCPVTIEHGGPATLV